MIDSAMAAVMLECTPRRVRQLVREHHVIGCMDQRRRLAFRLADIERIATARHMLT